MWNNPVKAYQSICTIHRAFPKFSRTWLLQKSIPLLQEENIVIAKRGHSYCKKMTWLLQKEDNWLLQKEDNWLLQKEDMVVAKRGHGCCIQMLITVSNYLGPTQLLNQRC